MVGISQHNALFVLLLLSPTIISCLKLQVPLIKQVGHPKYNTGLFQSVNRDDIAQTLTDQTELRTKFSLVDRILRESLSGFVVSLTTLPPSISYANIIGIHPLAGVYSCVVMGIFMSIFAGNGLIGGAAGVITIPITKLVRQHGIQYMTSAILLSSIFEVAFGVLKFGKYARYVKTPVLAGFSNAFALFLIKSQMKLFMVGNRLLPPAQLFPPASIALLCIACIKLLPTIGVIPPSLLGLLISSLVAIYSGMPLTTLASVSGPSVFKGGLQSIPPFQGFLPSVPWNLNTLKIIFPTASSIAIISIIATSLVARIACESKSIQYSVTSETNRAAILMPILCPTELRDETVIGLGLGNAVTSVFGGIGGCGLIPNTILNTRNGGNSYISSLAYSASTAMCVLLFAPIIGRIPMAALAGVMLNVASTTGKVEETMRIAKRANKSKQDFLNLLGLIVSSIICFQYDMGAGVVTGVIITYLAKIGDKLKKFSRRIIKQSKQLLTSPSNTTAIDTKAIVN